MHFDVLKCYHLRKSKINKKLFILYFKTEHLFKNKEVGMFVTDA